MHLLPFTGSDHVDAHIGLEDLKHRPGHMLHRCRRRFPDEYISVLPVSHGEEHEVYRDGQGEQEPGHIGIRYGQRMMVTDLIDEEREDRPAGVHDIPVPDTTEDGIRPGTPCFGKHQLLHEGLGHPHGVDWVDRLVGT